MQLGAFSVSLAVKDLKVSLGFYEKLGFELVGGDGEHYSIVRNGQTVLGLFQGMFENNILTFNPGWDQEQQELSSFEDVRQLHERATAAGLEVKDQNVTESAVGPAHFTLIDPDGNVILVDQHVGAK